TVATPQAIRQTISTRRSSSRCSRTVIRFSSSTGTSLGLAISGGTGSEAGQAWVSVGLVSAGLESAGLASEEAGGVVSGLALRLISSVRSEDALRNSRIPL